jgi:hypothetical protein
MPMPLLLARTTTTAPLLFPQTPPLRRLAPPWSATPPTATVAASPRPCWRTTTTMPRMTDRRGSCSSNGASNLWRNAAGNPLIRISCGRRRQHRATRKNSSSSKEKEEAKPLLLHCLVLRLTGRALSQPTSLPCRTRTFANAFEETPGRRDRRGPSEKRTTTKAAKEPYPFCAPAAVLASFTP